MAFIRFEDKQIHYNVVGKGSPVVFLHGFCEDSRMWKDFTTDFSQQIITIDLPGFGKSELLDQLSIEGMAEIVIEVLNELEIDKCILLGHSMGGYIGLAFAEKYADRLIGLGMLHSHPFGDTEAKKENRRKSIEFVKRNGAILYAKQFVPKLFAPNFVGSNNFLINRLIFEASKYNVNSIIANLEAMMERPDRSDVLKNINCPVLFIVGKLDQIIDYEMSKDQITMPQVASIHILPKVGHLGIHEASRQTEEMVEDFIVFCEYSYKE